MAEPGGSILGALWNWVTPRAAEAEVMGTPTSQRMLGDLAAENQAHQGQYLYDMYQRILDRAKGHPATVGVMPWHGLISREGVSAAFQPQGSEIRYDPRHSTAELANVVPHELLHFLNAQTSNQPVETQHALMQKLLGTQVYQPPEALQGYQPGAFSPVEHSIINEWMGGPRDWPR
jgi:hypothetical protein